MRSVRIAHALIRLYPRAWRVRYAGELGALLQDQPPSFPQLVDLLRGCGSEWGRVLSDPIAYPRLSVFPREPLLGSMQLASGLLFGLVVIGGAELLRGWRPSPVTMPGVSVAMFVYLAAILRVFPVTKSRWTRYHVGVAEVWVWLAMIASLSVLERWSGAGPQAPAPMHGLLTAAEVIRVAACLWFLSMSTKAAARAFETHRVLQAAQRDEYRVRLRLETAERYADDAPAEIEIARSALADVHDRIRRHADELRRIPLLSLIGLRKP